MKLERVLGISLFACGGVDAATYLGCFLDGGGTVASPLHDPTMRALPGAFGSGTVSSCITVCSFYDYLFAGIEKHPANSDLRCWCGNGDYAKYGLYPNGCTATCPLGGTNCGGDWAISVYLAKSEYLGCWLNGGELTNNGPRALTKQTPDVKSKGACIGQCNALGALYAGIEFAYQCWCSEPGSENYQLYPPERPQSDCDYRSCINGETGCGRGYIDAVYRSKTDFTDDCVSSAAPVTLPFGNTSLNGANIGATPDSLPNGISCGADALIGVWNGPFVFPDAASVEIRLHTSAGGDINTFLRLFSGPTNKCSNISACAWNDRISTTDDDSVISFSPSTSTIYWVMVSQRGNQYTDGLMNFRLTFTVTPATSAPSPAPTAVPTAAPVTATPTMAPVTSAPTKKPGTRKPTTPKPTSYSQIIDYRCPCKGVKTGITHQNYMDCVVAVLTSLAVMGAEYDRLIAFYDAKLTGKGKLCGLPAPTPAPTA